MFTLVEPCIIDSLVDRPHLGCAMLIAACQREKIKTCLIKGQTRYLKDMFVSDNQEIWNLLEDLKTRDLKKLGIVEYRKFIREKGIKKFQTELRNLYKDIIVEKKNRDYFNGLKNEEFYNLHHIFIKVYFYYLTELNFSRLKIVERYVSEIINNKPCYIGFSLQGYFDPLSRLIRKRIKEVANIPIIVGGALTPFIDLKDINEIFEREYFDYLIIGAGDFALPSLIGAMENNSDPQGIPNVFYKKNKKIIGNKLNIINNLDDLPFPDYSQFNLNLYLNPKIILPLQTSRGCSWRKCVFCSHHSIDFGGYREFGVEKVIETIRYLQKTYNCKHFAFHDEQISPERAKIISNFILNNNLKNIYINIYARPGYGYNNNNLLKIMRRAGFVLIHWGLESGSQRILDSMAKGTDVLTVEHILRKSSKNNISNVCFVLFGFPGEFVKDARKTVEFLRKNADYIDEILYGYFMLEPYSPIGKNPAKWGLLVGKDGSCFVKRQRGCKDVKNFYKKFGTDLEINSIRVTTDKLKYLLPGLNRRMLHFLNSSYRLMSNEEAKKLIRRKKLSRIFPIILGEIKKNGENILYPVNIKETTFVNRHYPEKERSLEYFEEKVYSLSDGLLSIEEIILSMQKKFKGYREDYIRQRVAAFFYEIFSKNWGIAFSCSWND